MARDPRSVDERRKDILLAAEELITRLGYNETSLDMIVEKAGCSKSMIYSYFGDKLGLLNALSEEVMRELMEALADSSREHLPIDEALLALAQRTLRLVVSARHIGVLRVIVSRFSGTPSVGQAYYDIGPGGAQDELGEYLDEQVAQGVMEIQDTTLAARQFFALLLWDHLHARMIGVRGELSEAQIDTEARRTVDAFLRLFPPRVDAVSAVENRNAAS